VIVDGYVRVSHVGSRAGDSFISVDVQRERIERWAQANGVLIAQVFEELDESGARRDRPLLEEAIARVECGDSQGVVVAYLSRFGRSLSHGLSAIERITAAGGRFVSVQEGDTLDFSTDTGRLVLRMLFSIAEWELDRTKAQWAVAAERAIGRGIYMGGTRPFGYRRGPSGRLEVDAIEGPILSELFRRRADGAGLSELRDYLNETGVPRVHGGSRWEDIGTIEGMMECRVALGEVRYGAAVNADSHAPLVDAETWERAQAMVHRVAKRSARGPALLRGILRCAGCQRLLRAAVQYSDTSHGQRTYYCGDRDRCPAPAVIKDRVVEPYVELLFWQELASTRLSPVERELERLKAALARHELELSNYRDNPRIATTLGADRFANGLAIRVERVDRAALAVARMTAIRGRQPDLPSYRDLRQRWPSMPFAERREAIAQVISCGFVAQGRWNAARRLHVYRHGRGPTYSLPGPRSGDPLRPFDPSQCPAPIRLRRKPDPWAPKRIMAALEPFLAGRDRWPSFLEFQQASLVSLYQQVEQDGGAVRWAAEMGIPFVTPPWLGKAQPERTIRAGLAEFLAGRTTWPTYDEFRAAGLYRLRNSVNFTGGPERWAREFGVTLDRRQRTPITWTYGRIERELAVFTQGRRDWPPHKEFHAAGLQPLYDVIVHWKLRDTLAKELGLSLPKGRQKILPREPRRWTDEAIAAALDEMLAGRDEWPTAKEMTEAGLRGLDERLQRERTQIEWARRYGVHPRPMQIARKGR
jgi:DNA invertase Pin-like site-specific DNA recombinase